MEELGNLSLGSPADVTVLRGETVNFGFTDMYGARQNGRQRFVAELTLRDGIGAFVGFRSALAWHQRKNTWARSLALPPERRFSYSARDTVHNHADSQAVCCSSSSGRWPFCADRSWHHYRAGATTNGAVGGIRTVLSFMTLSPGVGGDDTNARVNGQLGGTYRIFVDGQDVSNNNSSTSTAGQPSVENVEEFSLQTSNFAAEYRQLAGGMFTFAMRSGTNKFHGSLYEYFTNEKLDASVPFGTFDSKGNALPHAKPKSRKNDYGGLIAGPVWIPKLYDGHNKTFFTLNYEGFRNVTSLAGSVNGKPVTFLQRAVPLSSRTSAT